MADRGEVSELTQLEPTNLRVMARSAIRASVITGQLRPGVIYPVSYFASRLGVSATPAREALLDLSSAGLLEVARNKGFRVPDMSEHDLDEIYQLRLLIEVPSVAAVAGRLSAKDERRCTELAQKIEACAASGDVAGFLEFDRLFHSALLSALRNDRLVATVERLKDQARLWALPELARTEQLVASAHEHALLVAAVTKGDADAAREIMVHHLEHTRGLWAGKLESDGS